MGQFEEKKEVDRINRMDMIRKKKKELLLILNPVLPV